MATTFKQVRRTADVRVDFPFLGPDGEILGIGSDCLIYVWDPLKIDWFLTTPIGSIVKDKVVT